MMTDSQVVRFVSDGSLVEADYYPPANADGPVPGIVVANGYSGVRHELPVYYAQRFSDAGYAVIVPDFRGWGTSEGERNRIFPLEQAEDLRTSLSFLETLDVVDSDRLGIWGTSGGGAQAVYVAGTDRRIKAAVGQVGYADGRDLILGWRTDDDREQFLADLDSDRLSRLDGRRSEVRQILDIVGSKQSVDAMSGAGALNSTVQQVSLHSAEATMAFRPGDVAADIACPIMLVGADLDDVCPVDSYRAILDKATGLTKWISYPVGHYGVYEPELQREVTDLQIEFFATHLN